jgi:hypothetical protein
MAPHEVKETFLSRLKIGIPLVLYESRGRGKPRRKVRSFSAHTHMAQCSFF